VFDDEAAKYCQQVLLAFQALEDNLSDLQILEQQAES